MNCQNTAEQKGKKKNEKNSPQVADKVVEIN